MQLGEGDKANFNTLLRAASDGRLALLDVQRRSDGKSVAAVVAVSGPDADSEYTFAPLAIMVEGNPYELFNPPDVNGAYHLES